MIIDSNDDIRVLKAIRRRCGLGTGRLLVSPPPSTYSVRTLACHVIEALTPFLPPGPWRYLGAEVEFGQLELFPFTLELVLPCHPLKPPRPWGEQLAFFPELAPPPRSEGVGPVTMHDLVPLLRRARIREVCVLRAQALPLGAGVSSAPWRASPALGSVLSSMGATRPRRR